ncbi:gamma-glutamylcyclotransferase [Croceitalea sp. MTPC5]|uniref:gamma-glutamylcyclotransferase family protein n=1 Tax=Croceitalea sp. MTPC5 TaxID=3056565 RepID=UPI002B39376C|nr:gamma-glutamylcyclotransferase [Croceitalea sp. MTPC5]
MRTTHKLFSYGRLQEHEVQQAVLNRKLKGTKDILVGFKKFEKQTTDQHPIIEPTNDVKDAVKGVLYPISNLDLYKIDSYRSLNYARKLVTLKSGTKAWAYLPHVN